MRESAPQMPRLTHTVGVRLLAQLDRDRDKRGYSGVRE